jgi:hypothetical protein
MNVSFGVIHNIEKEEIHAEPNVFEFKIDWFIYTTPSIKDTHLFLPDWEDPNDLGWVMMYFIAENFNELLQNNEGILCDEAKMALNNYLKYFYSEPPNEEERKSILRNFVENLKNERI